jgi:hypothetical protein
VIGSPEIAAHLAPFRGRKAAVVLWNIRTDHRLMAVTPGSYDRMWLEARTRLRNSGFAIEGTLTDIAPATGGTSSDKSMVVLASAPRAEVAAAIAPLVAAGIRVRSVLTPAAALQTLARLRSSSIAEPKAELLEAFVAIEERATCIALLRAGALVDTYDLPWGFLDELSGFETPRERYDVAVRLADELSAVTAGGRLGAPLAQVSVCGAMTELRSMTVQLMELLDIEVEPLDSLFGIDVERLPMATEDFHDAAAGIRVAWAAAANPRPALDLFRRGRRQAAKAQFSRAAVVAGTAAGLSIGWLAQREWPAAPPRHAASAVQTAAAPDAAVPASEYANERAEIEPPRPLASRALGAPVAMLIASVTPAPLPIRALVDVPDAPDPEPEPRASWYDAPARPWERVPPLTAPPRVVAVATSPRPVLSRPAPAPSARAPIAPPPREFTPPPLAPPPITRPVAPQWVAPQPVVPQPVVPQPVVPQPVVPQPVAVAPQLVAPRAVLPQPVTPSPVEPRAEKPRPPTPTAPESAPPPMVAAERAAAVASRTRVFTEAASPLDASLETILSGPDRALAIVDGRIVQVGDEVRGARIIEISASTVFLRDPQGRLRRLSLSGR